MPLLYTTETSSGAKLAVWHIQEDDAFFMDKLLLDETEHSYLKRLKAPTKRLQWLASRWLIRFLVNPPGQILMEWDDRGKPVVINYAFDVSISHSHEMAAVLVGQGSLGIDIEKVQKKVLRIARKFVNHIENSGIHYADEERAVRQLITLWCAKESIYKWLDQPGVDFKEHLRIRPFNTVQDDELPAEAHLPNRSVQPLTLKSKEIGQYQLVWVDHW